MATTGLDGIIRELSAGGEKIKLDPPYEDAYGKSTERDYIPILEQHGLWNNKTMSREDFHMIKWIPHNNNCTL